MPLVEDLVYFFTVSAVAVSAAVSAVPEAKADPAGVALDDVVEFTIDDLIDAASFGVISSIPIDAYVGEVRPPVSPLEQYRNRTEPFSYEELKHLLTLVGFSEGGLKTAWAVVMRESTGRPLAHNTNADTGDNSYGLFQINMFDTLGPYRRDKFDLSSNEVLFDPVRNAEIAFLLSKEGTDFGHWNVGPNAYRGDGSPPGYERWLPEYPEE